MTTIGAPSTVKESDEPTSKDADAIRTSLHGMWASVAGSWARHADYADARGAAVAEQMLALTGPQPGERVEVLGLTNVTTRVLDFERIEQPEASYDIVLCREGLMFALDPTSAAREIRRVLRPGGRTAIAVWGPRERNPWLGLVMDAVGAQLGEPVPPPGMPGPFALGDSSRLAHLMMDAGLADVAVSELDVPLHVLSFDEWWIRTSALAGPLSKILSSLPPDATQALRTRLETAVDPYQTPTGLEFPGVSLLGAARRPG